MKAYAESYNASNEAIHEAWAAVRQDYIDNLIRGMIDRVKAVLKGRGGNRSIETIDLLQVRAPSLTELLYLSFYKVSSQSIQYSVHHRKSPWWGELLAGLGIFGGTPLFKP
jgi:hypothetical protein